MRHIFKQAAKDEGIGFMLPAPVGGWNARDTLAKMPATDAIYLDNWFPSTTDVSIRPGSASHCTIPEGETVETLLVCATAQAVRKLFACSDSGVYDCTAAGAVTAVEYALTNGRVEATNINVAGEPWLWCCNGVDKSFLYKSSTDTFQVIDNASTPALTGLDSDKVTNVSIWKSRVILTERGSLSFWYLPLNSVGGAASEFALGAVFKRGGYLVATANWSLDAGDGPDDRFVAITSEGEVAIYQGTDPSNADTFSLVGVYHVGKPIGKRCFTQIAGDLAVLTEQGLWPLSKALESSTIDRKPALTDKIQEAFNLYFKLYGDNFGWQPLLYPQGPALLVNVPLRDEVSYQFVMNTITGAWCRFKNWNATCFAVSGSALYFATSNSVLEAWTGTTDRSGAIVASAKTAFTYGPVKARSKQVKLLRPVLATQAPLNIQFGLDTNFSEGRITSSVTNRLGDVARFDEARFDFSSFAGGTQTYVGWKSCAHTPGKAFAMRMRISVHEIEVRWSATDFICAVGGLLS